MTTNIMLYIYSYSPDVSGSLDIVTVPEKKQKQKAKYILKNKE